MSFREEIDLYRDRFGYPTRSREPFPASRDPEGNCLMFLAEEMLILEDQGLRRFQDTARFSDLVGKCQLQLGNYARTPIGCPFREDQEQQDDFIGIATASAILGTAHAFQIFTLGRCTRFRWKFLSFRFAFPTSMKAFGSETTDVNQWLGRSPAFVAHLHWAAGVKPNWFYRIAWSWALAFAGWFDPLAQDPWRIGYLMARTAWRAHRWYTIEYWAVRLWAKRLFKHWPGGIPDVRKRYFQDPNHPLATWMKEDAWNEK